MDKLRTAPVCKGPLVESRVLTEWVKLAPCPFCGPNDDYPPQVTLQRDIESPTCYAVQAPCCDFEGPLGRTPEEVVEAWNNRFYERDLIEARQQAHHWKNNHDSQVAKARVLIERVDMPLERVQAYQHICALELRIALLEKQLGIKQ